ncbi:MAG: hypothetical protein MI749_14390, partial [Desulfovibrionales bacterium]|nr:hypothetical protein [Desulfovibrionales bacterium]
MKTFGIKCLAGLATMALIITSTAQAKTWKMSVGDSQSSCQYIMGQKFAQIVEEETQGKYKLQLFPNGQLGSEQDTVNDCAMGTLDFSVLA